MIAFLPRPRPAVFAATTIRGDGSPAKKTGLPVAVIGALAGDRGTHFIGVEGSGAVWVASMADVSFVVTEDLRRVIAEAKLAGGSGKAKE